jgi:hypothetical protein
LTNLCGTEDARFAAIAADEAVECVYRLHDDGTDGWLEPITAFLKLSLRKSLFPPRPPMEKRRRPDVDLSLGMQATGDTYRFWEHVIQRAIRRLVRQLGVDAFSSLLSAGWLGNGPPMSREVHARIRTELNVALGANFRSNWHDELEVTKFLSLLEDLIAGTALPSDVVEQRMRAFFMIRHTEVTGRNPGVSVDHRLLDALGQLCNDPKLIGPLGRWRTPMMEANGLA